MKLNDLFEQGGVGVVAKNAKQAKDPRYSMSITKDVQPGETERQAAKFGNKLDKDGKPPLLGEGEEKIDEKALSSVDFKGADYKLTRIQTLADKIEKGEEFLTVDNRKVRIAPSKELIDQIRAGNIPSQLPLENGGAIKLSQLEKTSDFGGKGAGSGTQVEEREIASLAKQIDELRGDEPFIMLKVANDVIEAAGVRKTPGTPKSDFEILDSKGNPVAFISHKDGSPADPKKFGQWAGLTSFTDHPEVQKFAELVKKKYPEGMTKGDTAIARVVSDTDLQKRAIYGKDWNKGSFGINNVTSVMQGPVRIVKTKDGYELQSLAEFYNGEDVPDAYVPILIARYSSDRNDFKLPHTRMSLYPAFGRKVNFASDEEDSVVAEPIKQVEPVTHRVTRPDWHKDWTGKEAKPKSTERAKRK